MSNSLPIQLISTDFDGTLHADLENPPVPHVLQAMIADLQQRGAKWVINTGRDLSSLLETMARAHLTIKPDYLVVVEREIYTHENSQYISHAPWNDACTAAHDALFLNVRKDLPDLIAWVEARFKATIYEDSYSPFCLIADNNDDTDAIQAHLETYCQSVPHLTFVRNDVYARFSHVDYNKGSSLAEVARLLDIKADHILAAGDHYNDISMLSTTHARMLVAPANAIAEVKQLVQGQKGYVSHQPYGNGVARGIEFFMETRE